MGFQEATLRAMRLLPAEIYSRDAVNDEQALKDIESYEGFLKRLQGNIERGLSKCTKLVEERGIDLQDLVENFLTSYEAEFPSGLTLELEDWISNLIVADIMEARLERLRALLQTRQNTYSKLRIPVFRQSIPVPVCSAERPVIIACAESRASQRASQPAGVACARHFAADSEDDVTVPLLPRPRSTMASEEEANEATPLLHRQSGYILSSGCHVEVEGQSIGAGAGGHQWFACLVR